MKMKNKKIDITLIILLILAIVLTLLVLSNNTLALNPGEKTTLNNWEAEGKTVGDFARYISYSPNEFMGLRPNKIFGLDYSGWFNQTVGGENYLEAEPLLCYNGQYDDRELTWPDGEPDYRRYVVATWYTSALCIYYSTAGQKGSYGDVVNVIDINTNPSSPSMTVHYEDKGGIKNHTERLTETENQAMAAYAYLLNQATLYERPYNKNKDGWELKGTFTKDLSSDSKISGMSKMYDCRAYDGHPISQIKYAILQILYGGQKINRVDKDDTVFKVFSECKVNGKQIIDVDYGGLTNSYTRVDWEGENMGNYLNNALAAGEKAVEAKCEFKGKDDNGNEIKPKIEIVNNNAYIGPFAVIYSGGTPTITIEGVKISGWARKNTSGGFGKTNSTSVAIPQSTEDNTQLFYLVASASSVESKEKIKVKVDLEYKYYTARVVFTAFRDGEEQNIMLYAAKEHTGNMSVSQEVELMKEIVIQKQDEKGNNLKIEGIQFEIYDSTGKKEGTLTTDKNGKTEALKIEANKQYTIKEISNTRYGYQGAIITDAKFISGKGTISVKDGEVKVKVSGNDIIIGIKNEPLLGNITLIKNDEDYPNIKLEDVGFIVEISSNSTKTSYLALYNEKGALVKEAKGKVTINEGNIATKSEYRVEYVSNKAQATTFITGDNGILTINNLEVYKKGEKNTTEQYSYTLTETSNSNYGYIVNSQKISNVKVVDGQTTETTLGNKQELVKISGYVWIENPTGKSNSYDNVYTNSSQNGDKKLKDLYTGTEGKLKFNANAEIPVKIQLQDKKGNVIKDKPDAFDPDGKYTFVDLKVDQLSNYQVVFEYDGLYYTTVVPKQGEDVTINSKVKEVQKERNALSEKFSEVGANGTIGGQNGAVTYTKQDNQSKVESINIDTSISANTNEAGVNLATELDNIKKNAKEPVEGIDNINMGLVIREQPDLALFNDIEKVIINVNGYEYSYVYATRNLYTEKQEDQLGVKFENEAYLTQRYTRTIYASDIQAAKEGNAELKVSIVYKTTIVNESRTLTIEPKQISNYFDNRYTIESVNSASGVGVNVKNTAAYDETYNVAQIGYSGQLKAGEQDEIYIRFNVQKEAIIKLLDSKSTYYNAVEIDKYTSYYTQETGKDGGKAYTTDVYQGRTQLYAGIDEDSAPGNIEIKLINHPSGGTKILDTSKYEDDTDAAPSLILEAGTERAISGIVWEDTNVMANGERLGNGIYDSNEKPIANVKLQLYTVKDDGTLEEAKYSNGELATATTAETGEYTFGGYTDANGKRVGILPGTYIIKYMYNHESYIVGGTNLNAADYKSTIIKSNVIKSAINNADTITYDGQNYEGTKWYLIEEKNGGNIVRYSDAVDDMTVREAINVEEKVTYQTAQHASTATMVANTPIMEIGIEYTIGNEEIVSEDGNGTGIIFRSNFSKVDFGIIERPNVDYSIDKQITSLEIVTQTGSNIVPKGNPYTDSMTYIRALDGLVSAEIDASLLQGATLKLEYRIAVTNNSDIDYKNIEYYYYGVKDESQKTTVKINKVVDYLDANLELDSEKVEENKLNGWLAADGTENITSYEELFNQGLISEAVRNELKQGNCKVFITDAFNEVERGNPKEIKLYASALLGVSFEINAYNDVEIIELSGGRTVRSSTPGNYVPKHDGGLNGEPNEPDDDRERLVIVPPTGTTTNYTAYIIAIGTTLAILAIGIIITRKVMKKQ